MAALANGSPGAGPYLIGSGLLPVHFLHHDERQNDPVLVETDRGAWIGEEDAGVKDESPNHGLLTTGAHTFTADNSNYKHRIWPVQ